MAMESEDPLALWRRLKLEYSEYMNDKSVLKQKQENQQRMLRQLEEKKREYARHKDNEERSRMNSDALQDQIEDLHTARDQLSNDVVESSGADTPVSDKEKTAVEAILLAEWKEDLVNLLFKEKMEKRVRDPRKVLSSDHLQWEYILTKDLGFDEIYDLLKKFIEIKKASIRELLLDQRKLSRQLIYMDKSLGKRKLKELAARNNPCIHVDIMEYLEAPELDAKGKKSWERLSESSKKAASTDIFSRAWEKKPIESKKSKKDLLAEAKSYDEYLHVLDKEMYNAYMIYEKQKEVYKKLSKSDKLVLARSSN